MTNFYFGSYCRAQASTVRWNEIKTVECSIARALSVVGDRWTMMIVRDVFLGIRRFDAIQQDLGLTPHRLSHRLGKLIRDAILVRVEYQERPRRFEYRLTEKGIDLFPLIVVLNTWGDRWMASRAGAPIELVHRKCGHATKPALACPSCKEKIVPREMSLRPGPALKRRGLPGRTFQAVQVPDHFARQQRS